MPTAFVVIVKEVKMKTSMKIPDRISALDGRLEISISKKQTDGTDCYYADGDVFFTEPLIEPQPRLDSKEGFTFEIELDRPERILAIYQHRTWWVRPSFPESFEAIPERTQMLLLKYRDETICLTAESGDIYRTDFSGAEGKIRVRTSSNRVGDCHVHTPLFAVASDLSPYDAARRASLAIGRDRGMLTREERVYPEIFEGFGWCTWDAFYRDVTEEGIIAKLEELREKQIPVRWVLIDDGWQDADYENLTLSGLDARRSQFPDGLGSTVRLIKEKYGVKNVGVWHAVFGYWCGLTPGSEAEKALGASCSTLPDGREVIAPDAEKAFRFYDTWHSYLKEQGIDFVKVDSQSAISVFYDGIASYGASAQILQGLERSVEKNFGGALINCMGMAPQELWGRKTTMLTRTSDDFFPTVEGSFIEHAMQNAYNSLWSGAFYTGDWDMFFTEHPEAKNNAVLRSVSGGPVYVSDKVGKTDPQWLRPLMEDGKILRCDAPGLPAAEYLFKDPRKCGLLKVINRRGKDVLVAVFDLRRDLGEIYGKITMADIALNLPDQDAEAYTVKGVFSGASGIMSYDIPFLFKIESASSELFILSPI